MSIVSAKLDSFTVRAVKHIKTVPQRDANDGTVEPVFSMPEVLPVFNQGKKIMMPGNPRANQPLPYVPLKCDQENSHALGASLFNAPEAEYMARLDVPSDMPQMSENSLLFSVFPKFNVDVDFEAGIRSGKRMIKLDDVNEPTRNMFRPAVKYTRGVYVQPSITYDIGNDELKAMMKAH
jgi:hypothetical protein